MSVAARRNPRRAPWLWLDRMIVGVPMNGDRHGRPPKARYSSNKRCCFLGVMVTGVPAG